MPCLPCLPSSLPDCRYTKFYKHDNKRPDEPARYVGALFADKDGKKLTSQVARDCSTLKLPSYINVTFAADDHDEKTPVHFRFNPRGVAAKKRFATETDAYKKMKGDITLDGKVGLQDYLRATVAPQYKFALLLTNNVDK